MDAIAPPSPPHSALVVRPSPGRGRGVFATSVLRAGLVLERAPVLVVPRADLLPLRGTRLDDYWFWWDEQHNALGLGWASLYNHACPANAAFRCDHAAGVLVVTAVADIAAGDEVTINYHGVPDDARPPWFEAR